MITKTIWRVRVIDSDGFVYERGHEADTLEQAIRYRDGCVRPSFRKNWAGKLKIIRVETHEYEELTCQ